MRSVILGLIFIGFAGTNAFGCLCEMRSHRQDFRDSTTIIVGTVTKITPKESADNVPSEIANSFGTIVEKVSFDIEKSWKRSASAVTLWSESSLGGCGGFRWTVGEKYLVYVVKSKGGLDAAATYCGRSRLFAQQSQAAAKELKQLDSFWFRTLTRLNPFSD